MMGSSDNTPLGDRMKQWEFVETSRKAMRGLPLLARLDGRSFHTYTRGLDRPFDTRLSRCMLGTMEYLVKETHALTGYVQSDEITLLWDVDVNSESQFLFDGKFQKLVSVLAGMASAKFSRLANKFLPLKDELLPVFDCRVWQVPTKAEAANVFLWRELDATKNAISMAAFSMFSPNQLHGKNGSEKQEMMFSSFGVNFNDYPAFFKRGVYAKRVEVDREAEVLLSKHDLIPDENGKYWVKRNVVQSLDLPRATQIANYEELLFMKVVEYQPCYILKGDM
jgi:tRNA(His) guanylyltransferase